MGMVLGKITVETPKYELVHACPDYEIRKYAAAVVAETTYDSASGGGGRDGGFDVLAKYIGAFGTPHNVTSTTPAPAPESVPMTAPVITTTTDAATTTTTTTTMQFVLPARYRRAGDAPRPTDGRVVVREEGERTYGVVKFAGVSSDAVVAEKAGRLEECLERDGYKVVGKALLGRYNPPWTLPPFRTNEVMLPLGTS